MQKYRKMLSEGLKFANKVDEPEEDEEQNTWLTKMLKSNHIPGLSKASLIQQEGSSIISMASRKDVSTY